MFAIVDIAGFQEKAEKGMKFRVQTLEAKEGATITFDKVMLISTDGKDAIIGKPYVAGAKVTAKVMSHGRGDKIVVRKFKRRKRYHKTLRGHRQNFTEIEIMDVTK
jgi:large subunit ribosomal protein L21